MARRWLLGGLVFTGSALAAEPVPVPEIEAPMASTEDKTEQVPSSVTPPAPAPREVDLAAMHAQLQALRDRLDKAEAQLAKQADVPATPKEAPAKDKAEKKKDFKLDLFGYYRIRGYLFGAHGKKNGVTGGLYDGQSTPAAMMNHRLRMGVEASYKDRAKLFLQFQAFNNVLWGDNAALSHTPLFANSASTTDRTGAETPNFELLRAWTEVRIPIGEIRAGRMGSNWGLGILANDGNGFDDDFGENYRGDTFDRFLFLTNPVSIGQAITKKEETKKIPLFLGVGFDRLVDSPLQQYYGYKCKSGVEKATDPSQYDARCDLDGDSITDQDHDYSESRTASQRQQDWWANERDDVWEMIYMLLYHGEETQLLGKPAKLTAGSYVVQRFQKLTSSNIVIGDVYFDAFWDGFNLAFEGVGIWGKTRALTLPSTEDPSDPLYKKASIYSYVARFGYEKKLWKLMFESGYASGDARISDSNFTGRALHPDYNVGLLLYEEVLAQATAARWVADAEGLRSLGGVYNSNYIFPRFYVYPYKNTQIIAGFLMAWPDRPDGAVILCDSQDAAKFGCTSSSPKLANALGWEIDLAVKHRWLDHMLASVEMGYAHATNRIPLQSVGLNPKGNFFTLQARLAWEF